jgi:hypothetical protein
MHRPPKPMPLRTTPPTCLPLTMTLNSTSRPFLPPAPTVAFFHTPTGTTPPATKKLACSSKTQTMILRNLLTALHFFCSHLNFHLRSLRKLLPPFRSRPNSSAFVTFCLLIPEPASSSQTASTHTSIALHICSPTAFLSFRARLLPSLSRFLHTSCLCTTITFLPPQL